MCPGIELEFHVPTPSPAPEDVLLSDGVDLSAPGLVERPDPGIRAAEIRDLAFRMVRVLDSDGIAVGPWDPRLDPNTLRKGLRAMMLTRAFDERMFRAHRQGKTTFYMRSLGEEAIGAAQSLMLGRKDMCFPTYRLLSWLIARDYPLENLCHQIFSNAKDPLKGRQLPILYSARDYGFYSLSGNLGSRFGHAVGWAMASAFKGEREIAIAYVGEGTTAEGDFHEALTFASVYHAPVILCVTNNQYAISSFSGIAGGCETTFAAKALGYGIPGLLVDGNDFLAVCAATNWAAERARSNGGATLIELFTYRVAGHSTSDDPSKYRPVGEAERWPLGDPLERLKQHLTVIGEWDERRHAGMEAQVTAEVRAAVKEAEEIGTHGRSKPSVREMFEDVFKEPDWRAIEQRRELGI